MKFAVLGGDMRIAQMCAQLARDGQEVCAFALERGGLDAGVRQCSALTEACQGADCVVLPLPAAGQRGYLNTPLSTGEYSLREVFDALEPGQLLCAGRADEALRALARERGVALVDYFQREELAVANAVATAEGAMGILMQETAITLWESRILVIGFGRIGKLLAHRLKALGADVTVSSRSRADAAWCQAYGYGVLDTRRLEGHLRRFDAVVNTVPALVLDAGRLAELRGDAVCMDLASRPGGMDFAAASRLGVRAIWALSLPGEVAPVTAGKIIRDTIYHILEERDCGSEA